MLRKSEAPHDTGVIGFRWRLKISLACWTIGRVSTSRSHNSMPTGRPPRGSGRARAPRTPDTCVSQTWLRRSATLIACQFPGFMSFLLRLYLLNAKGCIYVPPPFANFLLPWAIQLIFLTLLEIYSYRLENYWEDPICCSNRDISKNTFLNPTTCGTGVLRLHQDSTCTLL